MAIVESDKGKAYSVILEVYRVGTPAPTDATEKWRAIVYLKKWMGSNDDTTTLTVGGSSDGFAYSGAKKIIVGTTKQELWRQDKTFTRAYGKPTAKGITVHLAGFAGKLTMPLKYTFNVSARAISKPAAPTAVRVEYRKDDQAQIYWTAAGSVDAPIQTVEVARRVNGGPLSAITTWSATGSGTKTVSGLTRGNKYEWVLRTRNLAGWSEWVATNAIFTTPTAPKRVKAGPSGNDVVVSWVGSTPLGYEGFEIWEGSTLKGVATPKSTYFVVAAPAPNIAHTYKVRAYVTQGALKLYSGLEIATPVQLLTPPSPPTLLTPKVLDVPTGEPIKIGWRHNCADGAEQTAWQVDYQLYRQSSTWYTLTGSTETETVLPALNTQGDTYAVRIRTKGASAQWGAWAGEYEITAYNPPTIEVVQPEAGAAITQPTCPFKITASPRNPSDTVSKISVTVTCDNPYYKKTFSNSNSGILTGTLTGLTHGMELTFTVTAVTKVAYTSTAAYTVAFTPPEPPTVESRWDEPYGAYYFTSFTYAQGGIPAVGLLIRGFDTDGEEHLIFEGPLVDYPLADETPPVDGSRRYWVHTVADSGAISTPFEITPGPPPAVYDFINFGDDIVRVRVNPEVTQQLEHAGTVFEYLDNGDGRPTVFFTPARATTITISGLLRDEPWSRLEEQVDAFMRLARWKGLVHVRIAGRPKVVSGVVTSVSTPRKVGVGYEVSVQVAEAI